MFQGVPAAVRNQENSQEENIAYPIIDNAWLEKLFHYFFSFLQCKRNKKAIHSCRRWM